MEPTVGYVVTDEQERNSYTTPNTTTGCCNRIFIRNWTSNPKSILQIIAAMTINPAKAIHHEASLGSIGVTRDADVTILRVITI